MGNSAAKQRPWAVAAIIFAAIAALALIVAVLQAGTVTYASQAPAATPLEQACPGPNCLDESCCADAEAVYRELRDQKATEAESCCADAEAVVRELGAARDV